MYCIKCGAEIPEGAKFCNVCGTNQEQTNSPPQGNTESGGNIPNEGTPSADGKEPISSGKSVEDISASVKTAVQKLSEKASKSSALSDGKVLLQKFFSKNPVSVIPEAHERKSIFWILALALNVLLFAFVSCNNIAQVVNHECNSLLDSLSSRLPISQYPIEDIQISALYQLFGYLAVAALIIFAVEFAAFYIPLTIGKMKPESPNSILNLVGVASFPLSVVLILNFIIGFIYPPLTLCAFLAAIFVHILLLYEGLRYSLQEKISSLWVGGIAALVITIIVMVVLKLAIGSVLNQALDNLTKYLVDSASGSLWNLFG